MIGVSVRTREAERTVEQARAIPRRFIGEIRQFVIPAAQRRADSSINVEPPPAQYPINWQSEKQRRYVMWLLATTNNLPYKRTGRVRSWRILLHAGEEGGDITAENGVEYSRFVFQPPYQQIMHKPTWRNIKGYAEEEWPLIAENMIVAWNRANRPITQRVE